MPPPAPNFLRRPVGARRIFPGGGVFASLGDSLLLRMSRVNRTRRGCCSDGMPSILLLRLAILEAAALLRVLRVVERSILHWSIP